MRRAQEPWVQICAVRHSPDGLFAPSTVHCTVYSADVSQTSPRRLGDVGETSGRRLGVVWESSGRHLGDGNGLGEIRLHPPQIR